MLYLGRVCSDWRKFNGMHFRVIRRIRAAPGTVIFVDIHAPGQPCLHLLSLAATWPDLLAFYDPDICPGLCSSPRGGGLGLVVDHPGINPRFRSVCRERV